jgi:hypothetical protein
VSSICSIVSSPVPQAIPAGSKLIKPGARAFSPNSDVLHDIPPCFVLHSDDGDASREKRDAGVYVICG